MNPVPALLDKVNQLEADLTDMRDAMSVASFVLVYRNEGPTSRRIGEALGKSAMLDTGADKSSESRGRDNGVVSSAEARNRSTEGKKQTLNNKDYTAERERKARLEERQRARLERAGREEEQQSAEARRTVGWF
jgi:hypothetical protein